MNPMKLFQMKAAWDRFQANHPKFPQFLQAVGKSGVAEGTVIEITVTTKEGRVLNSSLKLTEADMELVDEIKNIVV